MSSLKRKIPLASCRPLSGREIYERDLDVYADKMYNFVQEMETKDFKKKTKKQKDDFMMDIAVNNTPPGISPPTMIDPGLPQLEKLLEGGRWCTTFVDSKMTTKQTKQGKKHQFSAMVMVGDLNVRTREYVIMFQK